MTLSFSQAGIQSQRCFSCAGYALLPPGKTDNLSDSSHSEISSRSSICSVDSVPAPGLEERCNSIGARTSVASATAAPNVPAGVPTPESSAATHLNVDYSQPGTR